LGYWKNAETLTTPKMVFLPLTERAEYIEFLFFILLFADPGGIGSAFHRAEDAEKQNVITLRIYSPMSLLGCKIYHRLLRFKLQRQLLSGFPSLVGLQRWKENLSL
jgi:hypothetical protein